MIKAYMMQPQNCDVVNKLWGASHEYQFPFPNRSSEKAPFVNGRLQATGYSPDELNAVLTPDKISELGIVMLFDPSTDRYRVEVKQLSLGIESSVDAAASNVMAGAWQLTSMNGYSDMLSGIISDPFVVGRINEGSRVLFVRGDDIISSPEIVGYRANRSYNTEIWRLPKGQIGPAGSSSALLINEKISERVRVTDIVGALNQVAKDGIADDPSKTKMKIVSDLDGTLFDARAFVKLLFMEWFNGYDGVRKEELVEKVEWAQKNDPSLLIGWNGASVLQNLDMLDERVVDNAKKYFGDKFENSTKADFLRWVSQYEGVRANDLKKSVNAAFKDTRNPHLLDKRKVREVLQGLGITDKRLKKSTIEHFNKNFFSPDRRVDAPVIEGMVALVRFLQKNGFEMMFVTLRSAEDDTMSDGRSASEIALRRAGIWQNGTSILLGHEGEALDWSEDAYKAGNNEPSKWQMVSRWNGSNQDSLVVGALENAPAHVNGYREVFADKMVCIHPQGDNPPHSPQLRDGIFTVDTA